MTQNALGTTKPKGIADIALLIDCTGSMQPCLDALTQNVGRLIDSLTSPGANAPAIVTDWRVKVCGYRDAKVDGDQWWIESPFTSDITEVKAQLAALEAKGGGDEPESFIDALWKLIKIPCTEKGSPAQADAWRHRSAAARCIIVFTDASTHMTTSIPEAEGVTIEDISNKFTAERFKAYVFAPAAECYFSLQSIDRTEWETVGSLTDSKEQMKAFSEDLTNFRKVMEDLAKSISQDSVAAIA